MLPLKRERLTNPSYGAPAHSIEQWLESTADILQVEASFVYIPGILIVAFRDTDVHSTDILFIRYASPPSLIPEAK
jgi:uncharacterized membrane protein YjjP (DUF1212 family)